jgi:hypothetical protein
MRVLVTVLASVVAGAMNVSAASAGDPQVLSWQTRDVKDPMTDKMTRKLVSQRVSFGDGVLLEAHANCVTETGAMTMTGVEFAFDMFRGEAPAPFTQKKEAIAMRIRFDGGEVQTAFAMPEYANEVKTGFYNLGETEKPRSTKSSADTSTDTLARAMMVDMLGKGIAGDIRQFTGARSIRIELPLADGNAYVVDLNPQDQALKPLVQQCIADLGTHEPAKPNGTNERPSKSPPPSSAARTKPPSTPATAPTAFPQFPDRQTATARLRACGTEWKAKQAAGTVPPGMYWPQFWSECNKRRAAAGM